MDGMKLRGIREHIGKTRREIAIASGVTEGCISNLENGKITNPRIETLQRIAIAMDCTVQDFI